MGETRSVGRARALSTPERERTPDAAPAARRIVELHRARRTIREIARMAGVGHTTVSNIFNGSAAAVRVETMQANLAVE